MKSKLLLVDLDDTLCDTRMFKKGMFKLISQKSGISLKKVEGIYNKMKIHFPLQEGWPDIFSDKLSKVSSLSKNEFIRLIYQSTNFLKLNTNILDFVKRTKNKKLIITLGDKKLHKKKIKKLGIEKYFDGVIFVSDDKEKHIMDRIKNEKFYWYGKGYEEIVLIDDRIDLLKKLKKYSWITILIPSEI